MPTDPYSLARPKLLTACSKREASMGNCISTRQNAHSFRFFQTAEQLDMWCIAFKPNLDTWTRLQSLGSDFYPPKNFQISVTSSNFVMERAAETCIRLLSFEMLSHILSIAWIDFLRCNPSLGNAYVEYRRQAGLTRSLSHREAPPLHFELFLVSAWW